MNDGETDGRSLLLLLLALRARKERKRNCSQGYGEKTSLL